MIILDGGMGRELHRIGAPFRQPEWSALALMEAPHFVQLVHESFIKAGANIITTNSYSLVPFHLGTDTFYERGAELIKLSGALAQAAREQSGQVDLKIAASIPPICGSYLPQAFDPNFAKPILEQFCDILSPYCDLFLLETHSSLAEILLSMQIAYRFKKPVWPSMTVNDLSPKARAPELRSGEPVSEVVTDILNAYPDTQAVLFNCSQPEVMLDAVYIAREILPANVQIGVYANGFPAKDPKTSQANADHSDIREDLTPERYTEFAQSWKDAGAGILGGCCGIGPAHIDHLRAHIAE